MDRASRLLAVEFAYNLNFSNSASIQSSGAFTRWLARTGQVGSAISRLIILARTPCFALAKATNGASWPIFVVVSFFSNSFILPMAPLVKAIG